MIDCCCVTKLGARLRRVHIILVLVLSLLLVRLSLYYRNRMCAQHLCGRRDNNNNNDHNNTSNHDNNNNNNNNNNNDNNHNNNNSVMCAGSGGCARPCEADLLLWLLLLGYYSQLFVFIYLLLLCLRLL